MNEHTTPSILQRVPVILAVTAASYGLPVQAQGHASNGRQGYVVSSAAAAPCVEQAARDSVTLQQ
jgi:hypothetical protein